ncbi:Flp pilus assembly protein CpaB [Stenotrophomonas mori]|uniref:Flp pilus assembly protein CpaB n=1 Tax=Stenotrophomonas mori TaxID=2871096 RepID=A0ABT0SDY1_9GAMM|nr:Flp pilus assembly protein CpaB [Stenotrophomonas mori]MCL7713513.1 Flp pilus assembly protein CpaB [Stenotrophomonas mori]
MPKAIRITAALLLALAVLLAILAFGYGRRSMNPPQAAAPPVPTTAAQRHEQVVASRALTAGTPLSADGLTLAGSDELHSDSFSHVSAVVGGVLLEDVAAGQPIRRSAVSRGIALALNPGERAIAVPVDELASAGNRVSPGDYVDVFMSLPGIGDAGSVRQDTTQARLLLSRQRVLGYGDRDMLAGPHTDAPLPAETPAAEPGSRAESIMARSSSGGSAGSPGTQPARTAVLAVQVDMIGRLLLGAQSGKLFLALRNPADTAVADDGIFAAPAPVLAVRGGLDGIASEQAGRPENQAFAGIDLGGLAGTGTAARPHRPAPPSRPVSRPAPRNGGIEIVRGTQTAPLSSP